MSKVDEELTRRFRRAERPVGEEELFEGLARRRRRRRTLQRIEAGALAVAVLAGTIGGFAALRAAFGGGHQPAAAAAFGAEGAIVACTDGTGTHLCRIDAEGLALGADAGQVVRLTDVVDEIVSMPSVSFDGKTVVFDRFDPVENATSLWTIGIDGTDLRRLSSAESELTNASWGPDGSLVAVASAGTPNHGPAALAILDPARAPDPVVRMIPLPGLSFPSTPRFSPDGKQILIAAGEDPNTTGTHIYTVTAEGNQVTKRGGTGGMTPDWSPDGTQIVFSVGTANGVELFLCSLDCSSPRRVDEPSDPRVFGGLPRWSPDGAWISYQSEEDGNPVLKVVRIDGSEARPLASSVRDMAWIPSIDDSSPVPSPHPEPSPTVGPGAEGKDVGLGFNLCNAERLGGIDFLGAGRDGAVWVGFPIRDDGTCPRFGLPGKYAIAADHTGDGIADSWMDLPWKCYVGCSPYDATDLDGNGTEELILASSFSIMDYYVMTVAPNGNGRLQIQPILVAEPGHPPAGIDPGEPLRIDAGGDAGYGSQIECEGYPGAPVIVWSSSSGVVESNRPKEVHIVRIQLQSDGLFHVVGASDYTVPADQPSGIESTSPACGVDWHPSV